MRVRLHERVALATVVCLVGGLGVAPDPVHASIIHEAAGISSVGTDVSFKAELSISGDLLTVILYNILPEATSAPNDLLSSYYFDIVKSGTDRPALTYVSASGDIWLTHKDAADELKTAGANLKAVNEGDDTWQFKTMDPALSPFLGFGLGSVGNSDLTPNSFNGNVVDGMNYSIFAGEITTQNLDGYLLVKGPVTFTFSGVSGFSESDISSSFAFGLGTAPDSIMTPEPATLSLLALGALALIRRRRK